MRRIETLRRICCLLAGAGLALGYSLKGRWEGALVCLAFGLFGSFMSRRVFRSAGSVVLIGFVFAAAAGALAGVGFVYLLAAVAAALSTWDLEDFERRLRQDHRDGSTQILVNRHLKKLSAVILLGLFAAGIGASLRLNLNFWVIFFIGLTGVWTLSRAIRMMKTDD